MFSDRREKEIEYQSTIMEMRNSFKNQERVIEELMLKILNIKIENQEVAEVAEVAEVVID
jgi:hypothetical protein